MSQYTIEIPKIMRTEKKKKKQEQKRESKKIRSSNGNMGTNTGTFAKTVREPVLTNNPNKAKELLRTQLWKGICTSGCEK